MALLIKNQPTKYYSSANDDLVYTCLESSLYVSVNFKYICDVYVNGIKIAQLKSFPNPVSHLGVFNIGNVVRNYVESNLTFTNNTMLVQYFLNHKALVQCKFGYEYGTTQTQYLNVTVSEEGVFVNTYNKIRTSGSTPVLAYKEFLFATNRPEKSKVYWESAQERNPLLIPYFPGAYESQPYNIVLSFTTVRKSDGATTYPPNYTITNGGVNYRMTQLDLSPNSINAWLYGTYINSDTLYYTVQISTVDVDSQDVDSQVYYFYPYCESKYEVTTIAWLNQYGGYDSYQFSKKSKTSYQSEKKSFERIPYLINSTTGVMSYNTSSMGLAQNESTIVYDSKFKQSMTFNTDIIDEETYAWLSELIISPSVFIQLPNSNFTPVIIKDSNYEFKKRVNDKVFNLTVNVELQQQMNTQYR